MALAEAVDELVLDGKEYSYDIIPFYLKANEYLVFGLDTEHKPETIIDACKGNQVVQTSACGGQACLVLYDDQNVDHFDAEPTQPGEEQKQPPLSVIKIGGTGTGKNIVFLGTTSTRPKYGI